MDAIKKFNVCGCLTAPKVSRSLARPKQDPQREQSEPHRPHDKRSRGLTDRGCALSSFDE